MPKRNRKSKIGWMILVVLTYAAACFAVAPYLSLNSELSRVPISASFPLHYPVLLVHIFSSFFALVIGWLQFLPRLRSSKPHIHRMIGRCYLLLIAIGSITGLVVGMYTESYIRQVSFLTLVVLWLFTGWKGYRKARQRQFEDHGMWMARNYAVTLVAATARIVTPLCILIYIASNGLPDGGIEAVLDKVLEVNIWLGLVVNVIITEWAIVNHYRKKRSFVK